MTDKQTDDADKAAREAAAEKANTAKAKVGEKRAEQGEAALGDGRRFGTKITDES